MQVINSIDGHEDRAGSHFGAEYHIEIVYFLRSRGLLNGLAAGTNWVFRDESCHLEFAFEVVNVVSKQHPEIFDAQLEADIVEMMREAVDSELQFAEDLLSGGVAGLSVREMQQYLEYVADSRVVRLGMNRLRKNSI